MIPAIASLGIFTYSLFYIIIKYIVDKSYPKSHLEQL